MVDKDQFLAQIQFNNLNIYIKYTHFMVKFHLIQSRRVLKIQRIELALFLFYFSLLFLGFSRCHMPHEALCSVPPFSCWICCECRRVNDSNLICLGCRCRGNTPHPSLLLCLHSLLSLSAIDACCCCCYCSSIVVVVVSWLGAWAVRQAGAHAHCKW